MKSDLTLSLEDQKKQVKQVIKDTDYAYKKARSPKSKRANKNALVFWKSILESLNKLKELS